MDLTPKHIDFIHDQANQPKNGMSKPFLITASDDNEYILKNELIYDEKNKQYINEDAVFFQELLCYQLAHFLEVPIPEVAIIEITKEYIDNAPTMTFKLRITKPGLYFATKKIDDIDDNSLEIIHVSENINKPRVKQSWRAYYSGVENDDDFAKILVFDLLTANFDRFGNTGNLLVSNVNSEKRIYAIDFGHTFFGPFYSNGNTLKKRHWLSHSNSQPTIFIQDYFELLLQNSGGGVFNGLGKVFDAMQNNINFDSQNPFSDIIVKIESISDNMLIDMLNNIPDEWISNGIVQKNEYKQFIMTQKFLVKDLLNIMNQNGAFSNSPWEGDLLWPKEIITGIQ
ncbi:hypothetical protein KII93_04135 [Leuconostoc gelidum subsp. gasicomitatum]|uniref:HipA family kinase n=1 Tax=Leuconostoc gasicomitatum TaxID=115778 RepID=UPI0007E185E7|nr:HipA family kinase [Leuconostoc gasicomitatum]MBZ5947662.1 hypothetical protein [Leuconostoc gasicomitatum]CUW19091.1 hypothetical protein PB1E_0161 [Leuconostoc gasicomitatum]